MSKIGIQLIVSPKHNSDWFKQSLQSIEAIPNVKLYLTPRIEGDLTKARLQGMKKIKEEWISWVDADDRLLSEGVQNIISLFDDHVSMVVGGFRTINSEGVTLKNYAVSLLEQKDTVITEDNIKKLIEQTPNYVRRAVIRKECLEGAANIIGDEKFGVNWALVLSGCCLKNRSQIKVSQTPFYEYRVHENQSHREVELPFRQIKNNYVNYLNNL